MITEPNVELLGDPDEYSDEEIEALCDRDLLEEEWVEHEANRAAQYRAYHS